MRRELFPDQQHGLDLLRQSIATGHRRPMLQAPTGAGKTQLACAVVEGALAKGNRVVFTVPALSLIDQTVEAFWHEGIRDVGVIQANHPMTDWSKPVQVASVQTLMRRGLPEAATVGIIDEAHKWWDFYDTWMGDPAWAERVIIGLSATPWGRGLGKPGRYDDLLIATTTEELIRLGRLSNFRVYAPSHPDLSKVRTVAGDYHEGDLSEAMDQKPLVADIVTTWRERGENRPTFCFAVDRAHAKHIERQFAEAGITTGYIDAYTDVAERKHIRKEFHAGRIKVVCNVGCLTTGVDWDVRCIILARPTRSEMLFVQIIGRGLRIAVGKPDCIILDHSDSHLKLGFVTDIHHDRLNDGKPRAAAHTAGRITPLPKECPKCTYLKPAKLAVCPGCGFKPERQSKVEHEDGELFEMSRSLSRGKAKHQNYSSHEMASFYGQLLRYARQHGYQEGWVSHKFRDRFSKWPDHYRYLGEMEPTPATLAWIKSRVIAFAKARKGHDARASA